MLGGLILSAALWSGKIPGLSHLIHQGEADWVDRVATFVAPAPENENLIFLGIDEASISLSGLDQAQIAQSEVLPLMQQRFPWNRRVWAATIDRLADAGVKLIVLDLLFGQPSNDSDADTAFAEAIARHRSIIVLAASWQPQGNDRGGEQNILNLPHDEYLGPEENETKFGYVNFWPSADGIVRESRYRISMQEAQLNDLERHPDEEVYESLAAVVCRTLGALPPDGPKRLRYAVRGKELQGVKTRSIENVYAPKSIYGIFDEVIWQDNYGGGEFFKDKVVLVGPAAPQFHDSHPTPAGLVLGAQLHLQSIGCLLAGSFLHDAPWYWHWLGMLGMAMVGSLLVMCVKNPVVVVVLSLVAVGVWVVGVVFIANQTSLLAGGVSGVMGLSLVVFFGQSFAFLQERVERNRLFAQLSRSVSKDVAAAMVRSPDGYIDTAKGGRRRIVVLFSDVRGFTKRSERENPETLVAQLNEYLTRMVEIIFAHGGTLDKFIGDAIMATWGGLEDTRENVMAAAAVKAAMEMCVDLDRLNAKWKEEGREPFEAGIGIHIGDAVIGEVGSRQRSDFTAIGDAVNLASRIEGMTKMLQVPILVSGEVARLQSSKDGLCSLGRFRVKGRSEPVEILATGIEGEDAFMEALARLGAGDLVSAEGVMLEISSDSKLSGPAKFYLQQMEVWKQIPKAEWDGVITLESK